MITTVREAPVPVVRAPAIILARLEISHFDMVH